MRGKIISATSEQGSLILDYEDDGKYINMTRIKKLTVETQNTTYEIELGEFFRTKHGLIMKFEKIDEDNEGFIHFGELGNDIVFCDKKELEHFLKNEIIKHDFNLINLIEKGDYINGYKICHLDKTFFKCIIKYDKKYVFFFFNHEYGGFQRIKDVVTKESFENIKYEVKDND